MLSPFQTIRDDVRFLIDGFGGVEHVSDNTVRLKHTKHSCKVIDRALKHMYGTAFFEAHREWIYDEVIYVLNTLPSTMLMQFVSFLDSFDDPFDFETCHWETKYGEVFPSMNIKKEMAPHSEWVLCISPKTDKGIAMLRQEDSGEMSFVFFTNGIMFMDTYFPVLTAHPQAFEVEMYGENLLIIPRICKC